MNRRARRGGRVEHQRLDWPIGCGAFGVLTRADGTQALVETLRFGERDATVVRLERRRPGDRRARQRTRSPSSRDEDAAAQVGMPEPRKIKVGDDWRRIDPFHTERYRSGRFRSLVAMIYALKLPCRYSLLAAAEHAGRMPDFGGPREEDPEQTAGNVAERMAREPGVSVRAALRAELLEDAAIAVGPAAATPSRRRRLDPVLRDLERYLAEHHTDLPARPEDMRPEEEVACVAPSPQMSLFADGATGDAISRKDITMAMNLIERETDAPTLQSVGAELAPLSMAELRASVYGTNRGEGDRLLRRARRPDSSVQARRRQRPPRRQPLDQEHVRARRELRMGRAQARRPQRHGSQAAAERFREHIDCRARMPPALRRLELVAGGDGARPV